MSLSEATAPFVASQPTTRTVRPGPRRGARFAKRTIDLVAAMVVLVLAVPLMLFVVGALIVTDPGPVLFRQVRVGRGGKAFRIVKFRTMVVGAEDRLRRDPVMFERYIANGHKLEPAEDPRITRFGRWLRETSLDELPQLLNVVTGSMSLVGPRPVQVSEVAAYGDVTDTVLSVRPGMTGLWQVSGRSTLGRSERVELDHAYAREWSVGGDVGILLRTVGVVRSRVGAF